MPTNKLGRITEDVSRELSAILRELKDPRVTGCLLSVVRVEVTNDLSYCTAYVSTVEGLERSKQAVEGLMRDLERRRQGMCAGSWAIG